VYLYFLRVQRGGWWEIYVQRYVWLVWYHRSECSCGQPRSVTHHQMKCVSSALSSHVVLSTLLLLLLLMLLLWCARWCRLLTAATAQIARRTCANLYTGIACRLFVLIYDLANFSWKGYYGNRRVFISVLAKLVLRLLLPSFNFWHRH